MTPPAFSEAGTMRGVELSRRTLGDLRDALATTDGLVHRVEVSLDAYMRVMAGRRGERAQAPASAVSMARKSE
jgi:hypothetical protein